eukprot:TRINITY_DN10713_c0_g1_i2.p1 TRINITY_DN10713_c0_g1~~TRINITY_DN10713_c0_g1_i2.p1  ORF type:complete len:574 (-),score=68.94 TRINITY_DN10713_c0_g1_i2:199-1920(-)
MNPESPLLQDDFLQLEPGRKYVTLKLYQNSIKIECNEANDNTSSARDEVTQVHLKDVLGVHASDSRGLSKEGFSHTSFPQFLHIFWYEGLQANGSTDGKQLIKYKRRHLIFSLRSDNIRVSDCTRLNLWMKHIKYCKEGLPLVSTEKIYQYVSTGSKPVLFMVNPKSGQGKGEGIFWRYVAPVFNEAGKPFELKLTSRPNHARDFMKSENLDKWAAIVAVSGDGLLHEMINGLQEREDGRVASKVPIGIIPAGSGNGLARSLSHMKNEEYIGDGLEQAVLGIAKGQISPMDLTFVETVDTCLYSFLSIGYALLSDIDIESEYLRWMGEFRFYILSCIRVLNPRYYRAKLSYLPADQNLPNGDDSNTEKIHRNSGARVRQDTSCSEGYHSFQETVWDRERVISTSDETSSLSSNADSDQDMDSKVGRERKPDERTSKVHIPNVGIPRLKDPVPENWETIEDDFVILSASYQTHLAKGLYMSPYSKPADGVIYLSLLRRGKFENGKVPISLLVSFFLSCDTGNHVNYEQVETLPVKAFRLEPADTSVGHLTVDGELVTTGPIQAVVLPSAANIVA